LALTPLVYMPDALQPADLPRWLWLQLLVTASSFVLARSFSSGVRFPWGLSASLALLCLGLLSVLWAGDKGAALLQLLQWVTGFQLLILGTLMARNYRRATLYGLVFAGGLAAAIGVLQALDMAPPVFAQVFSPASSFINRNQAAEFVAALCPLALLLTCLETRVWLRLLYAPLTGLCWLFVVLGRSRSSWLALLITSLFLVGLIVKHPTVREVFNGWRQHLSGVLLLICLTVFIGFPAGNGSGSATRNALGDELSTIASGQIVADENVNTVAVRLALYRNSLGMLADFPMGVGLGNFSRHYGAYHKYAVPTPTYALTVEPDRLHNDPYQILVELGLPGLVLFGLLLLNVAGVLRRDVGIPPRDFLLERVGPLLVVLLVLVNGFASFPLHVPLTAGMFWLCCGLCLPPLVTVREKGSGALGGVLLVFNLLLAALYGAGLYANVLRSGISSAMYRGELQKALDLSTRAMHAFPLDWHATDELLSIACSLPNPSNGELRLAVALTERRPFSANSWYRRARLHVELRQFGPALDAVNRALKLLGEDVKLLQLRARIYQNLGDEDAARVDLMRAALLLEALQ